MRITKLLRLLLGLEETRVVDVGFDYAGLVVDVAPTVERSMTRRIRSLAPSAATVSVR